MKARHIPNIISICRILLVAPILLSITQHRFGWALGLFIVAGLSDALDGFLAKFFGWQSRLGSFLDPVADKLLLVSSYVVLSLLGLLPVWLAILVVARDLIIFGGAVAYYFLSHPYEGQPLLISKLNTLFQLLLVFAVLVEQTWTHGSFGLIPGLIGIVTLTTLSSGGLYVYIWGTNYLRERSRNH